MLAKIPERREDGKSDFTAAMTTRRNRVTSSIQATEEDTTKFLSVLENISQEQRNICALLDELILLMQMPSESVLKVLEGLLLPMGQNMVELTEGLKTQLTEPEA
ncbi:hypothetical protein BRCH_04454c [Candidatus Burkholderia brachyanthoides]|nr:hypothetical protein BRCH_04454c [Candidatus Burkholderia brachyanthoides]